MQNNDYQMNNDKRETRLNNAFYTKLSEIWQWQYISL